MTWDLADGTRDLAAREQALALRLPAQLRGLAHLAYNYWWSWQPGGGAVFREIDPERWDGIRQNPVRLLQQVSPARLERLAGDGGFLGRLDELSGGLDSTLRAQTSSESSIGFFCAEFGVHASLPFYAGGLGVLAGDLLKQASDSAMDLAGVGLMYSQGSFHQLMDKSGWQHEYWLPSQPDTLPMALVTSDGESPLVLRVPLGNREVSLQVWRVQVGRVPLFLLDSRRAENSQLDQWITARLYTADRRVRLNQYLLLGVGGVMALQAMGRAPRILHLNEGHAAFAAVPLLLEALAGGSSLHDAVDAVRSRTVFTTHTPVAAGNDVFDMAEVEQGLRPLLERAAAPAGEILRLGRDLSGGFAMTPFALRLAGKSNGVSRRHGDVARGMWDWLWQEGAAPPARLTHVTNGVHLPTWMALPMQDLLDRHLPRGWRESADWSAVHDIPDEELWRVRGMLRAELVRHVRERSVGERLGRGESQDVAASATWLLDDDALTIGFARRIATYKRLYLMTLDPERAVRILTGPRPIQAVLAGRAHPADEQAKRTVQGLFTLNDSPAVSGRAVFLEEYDLALAARLVAGCDVWVNLPRPPQEASGTSGMKSALNGGLQLSVLDGWWAEAFDGEAGWAIDAHPDWPLERQDQADSERLLDLLEFEVLPLFYDRASDGIPRQWCGLVKTSLARLGPRFTAARMLGDYRRGHAYNREDG